MEKFITLIIVAAALIPLFLRRVNQGEVGLIENLGKFSRETGPGLSFLIPGIQYLRKVDVREREVFIPTLEMYTKNWSLVSIDWGIFVSIANVPKATYSSMDVFSDVANLAHKHLRSVISTKSMDEIFSGYLDIERLLHDFLESKAMELGVKIHRVEIRKFK